MEITAGFQVKLWGCVREWGMNTICLCSVIWNGEKDIQFFPFFLHCITLPKSCPNKRSQLTSFSVPGLMKHPQQEGKNLALPSYLWLGWQTVSFWWYLLDGIEETKLKSLLKGWSAHFCMHQMHQVSFWSPDNVLYLLLCDPGWKQTQSWENIAVCITGHYLSWSFGVCKALNISRLRMGWAWWNSRYRMHSAVNYLLSKSCRSSDLNLAYMKDTQVQKRMYNI